MTQAFERYEGNKTSKNSSVGYVVPTPCKGLRNSKDGCESPRTSVTDRAEQLTEELMQPRGRRAERMLGSGEAAML